MFISKLEKQQINEWINVLQMKVESLQNDVTFLTGKLKALEGATKEPVKAPKASRPPRTEEQRLKQAAYMKEWHARKRQEKREAVELKAA